MISLTVPPPFKFNPKLELQLQTHVGTSTVKTPIRTHKNPFCVCLHRLPRELRGQIRPVFTRVGSDDGGAVDASQQRSTISEEEALSFSSSSSRDASLALFVQMLGLDHDPSEREQAVVILREYALGGKRSIDDIMNYNVSINLIVNLLTSNSRATCEAAAGLLRQISSVNVYRDIVAESGAIEEICGLLRRSSFTSVKEESVFALWNLSVDEKLQVKIANSDLLPLLIKFLEDESVKVMEAAVGVLANLTRSRCNHDIMVDIGLIPKLAKLLKTDAEGFKIINREARTALVELGKDECYKILVMEEGFLFVPLIGAAAYKSFKPPRYSWPSLPDGAKFKQTSKARSKYGASELLLGLQDGGRDFNLEEAKATAMIHRSRQQFLARIGIIEAEDVNTSESELSSWSHRFTILPCLDGVARLVLILQLEDESAVARAADAIADASISEYLRLSFKEAGAVKHLVQLMDHHSNFLRMAVIRALERLSVSNEVCQIIEEEGVLYPLINSLEKSDISESSTNMILDILTRILDPSKELKSRLYDGPVDSSKKEFTEIVVGGENEAPISKNSSLQTVHERDLLSSSFLSSLVEILKTSSPTLQRKAASVLEFLTVTDSSVEKIISVDIESGLDAVFRPKFMIGKAEMESEIDFQQQELDILEVEEAGLAISAGSRLFARLLDFEQFRCSINSMHFTKLLRNILVSSIPLHNKDWVAACLVKLSSLTAPNNLGFDNPINMEVTLYETIPRLIEQVNSLSPEVQEVAVVELNRIVSEGLVGSTRAVAVGGGIFPLVKLIENGNERVVEAGLAILYNLSMDSENHAAILAAGAVPVLKRIVLSERPQWSRALHLLRALPT